MNFIKELIIKTVEKIHPGLLYENKSYSQDGEDMVLKSFYEGKKGYKGFYVDVGAHHPMRFSNTLCFYKKGWKGINIEPTPDRIKLFHSSRKRDINLNVAVSKDDTPLYFYMFNEPALNSFNEKLSIEREAKGHGRIIDKKLISPFPLSEILDKHLPENQVIDFLSVDAEGFDYEVLLSNNWDKYRPLFILVESDYNPENTSENKIYNFLKEKGYVFAAKTMRTTIFRTLLS